MVFLVGHHVEIAGSRQTEDYRLFLPGFAALYGLVDGGADGMRGFRRGQDPFAAGKVLRRLEDRRLLNREEPSEVVLRDSGSV